MTKLYIIYSLERRTLMDNQQNEKIASSTEYVAIDASPELAKADLQVPCSGVDMSTLLSENTRCCGGRGCKRS